MRFSFLTIPLLFATAYLGPTAAWAQLQPTQQIAVRTVDPTEKPAQIMSVIPSKNCPIDMRAQQRGVGQTLWAISLEDAQKSNSKILARPGGMGVHVELNAFNPLTIHRVELAVEYMAPGNRALPVDGRSDTINLRKTFILVGEGGSVSQLTGDLLVGAAAGIMRVHLISVDYTNGTSWHELPNRGCSIEPNRFLRVATR